MQYVGRPVVFSVAVLLNLACLVTMLKWQPNPAQPVVFFLISGAWGIADGVWSPQIRGKIINLCSYYYKYKLV